MVVLGGMGSIWGSVAGAIVLTILPELLREISEYRLIVYGFIMVMVTLLRPQGLFGRQARRKKERSRVQGGDVIDTRDQEAG
jgi:branched-chain amino acid transport system permease protein